MDLVQLLVLAIIQGVTEFLPISSSGHLILVGHLLGEDQGKLIDVALHFGSLFAVLLYFWRDMRDVVYGPFQLIGDLSARRSLSWSSKLALLLIVATIPLVLVGAPLDAMGLVDQMRTIEVIGWSTLIFGVLLYVADRFSPSEGELKDWSWTGAIIMGVAQALALIPGTSRSGITMTAGRFLGFDRREAARISLLMSVPAIIAAAGKGAYDLYKEGDVTMTNDATLAALLSFISAYLALVLMMRWLARATFTPFVVYRLILGVVLLYTAYA